MVCKLSSLVPIVIFDMSWENGNVREEKKPDHRNVRDGVHSFHPGVFVKHSQSGKFVPHNRDIRRDIFMSSTHFL